VKYFVAMGVSTTRPFELSHVQSPGNGALLVVVSALCSGVAGAAGAAAAAGAAVEAGGACAAAFMVAAVRQAKKAKPLVTLAVR
jgi:hypothetical protein